MDEQLTPKEAAELLGCSVTFIRNQKVAGKLPYIQLGSRYTFNKTDVLNLRKQVIPHNNDITELE